LLKNLDRILGTAESWMSMTIRVPSERGKPWGIMLIKLMNKQGGAYLHDSFTRADAAIIRSIGAFLSTYLPGREVIGAVSAIVKPLQRLSQDSAQTGRDIKGEPLLDSLVDALSHYVQDVEALAFQLPGLPPACSSRGQDLARHQFDFGRRQSLLKQEPDGSLLYGVKLGRDGRMLVLLRNHGLPKYQAEIIRRVGSEVAWIIHEIMNYRQAVQSMVEIRHAIRSGVQGVLGNVKPALEKLKLIGRDSRLEVVEREFVRGAQFRKALEKALIAANHVGKVLEEGRYAFAGVRHDALRLGSHRLPSLVLEVLAIARIEAELRGITLNLNNSVQQDLADVVCDRAAIIIVLQNIIENAIKYGFRNTEIYISVWVSGDRWFISVEDTGVYIDPADAEVIFQPFKRVATHDPAAAGGESRRPGTGLGLSICQRIVKAHDPRAGIRVRSGRLPQSEAARTTFTISMPRRLGRTVVAEESS
jgi:signal transduction histidine kinase